MGLFLGTPGSEPAQSLSFTTAAANSDNFDGRAHVALPAAGTGCNPDGNLTLEFWIAPSSTAADNNYTANSTGATYQTNGNIIIDRDRNGDNPSFIMGISAGQIYFTCLNTSNQGQTQVGSVDLRDGNWHHVYATRNSTTGLIEVGSDGSREGTVTGPTGGLAYPDGQTPPTTCGASGTADCANSDPYMVVGCEKHEFQANGYIGLISCIRMSDSIRYSGASYTPPSGPFANDANTIGLWQMKEGSGTTVADESGNDNTMTIVTDGNSQPVWSSSGPF